MSQILTDEEIACYDPAIARAIESAVLAKIATTPAASPIPIDAPVLDEDGRQVRVRPGEVEKGREHARYLLALLDRTAWAEHDKVCAENEWQAATTCEIISLVAKAAASTTPEPSPLVAPRWMPIESAPKDGTPCICFWLDDSTPDQPERHAFDRFEEGVWMNYFSEHEHYKIAGAAIGNSEDAPYTHWMPLPAAPVRATEGEA